MVFFWTSYVDSQHWSGYWKKRTMSLIRSRPIHRQQIWDVFHQLQKKKQKAVFKPNHQNICMPTMHAQWSWNRNAMGKPAISDTCIELIGFPWNILLWVRRMTVIHRLLLQKCCLGRLVYLFYNKDSSHLWNSDFSLINTNKHKIISRL